VTTGVAGAERRATAAARPSTNLEVVAWLATIVMLLLYSQAWVVPAFGETMDAQEGPLVRALYFPAYLAGLFLVALKPGATLAGAIRQPFLIAILCLAAASTAWSIEPDQTSRRAIAVVLTTLCGVAIGARWRWPALAETFAVIFGILSVSSLITGAFIPSIGRMSNTFPGSWRGLWLEKNIFGDEMALALLIFAAAGVLKPERRGLWFGLSALAFGLIFCSTSKTSLVAVLLGFAVFCLVLLVRRGGSIAVLASYGAVVGLIGLGATIVLAPDLFLSLLGKDATLTGRTKIWAAIMRQIRLRPWLGYGYGAVWSEDTGWGPLAWIIKQVGFRPLHAHNSWLEQWLGMGYLGLGAWALYYLMTMVRAIAAMFRSDGALVALPFLVVYSLTSLTESVAVSYNDMRWVIFVAFSVALAMPKPKPPDFRPPELRPPEFGRLPQR
jgi:O-antigen ligase